jgi:hypothetical protein
MQPLEIFFLFGNISLLSNMIEDLKTLEINEAKNYAMTTCVLTLYLVQRLPIITFLINTLFFYGVVWIFGEKINQYIGEGDITLLPWVINGLLMHSLITTIAYLTAVAIIFFAIKKSLKIKEMPLYITYWFVFLIITLIIFF